MSTPDPSRAAPLVDPLEQTGSSEAAASAALSPEELSPEARSAAALAELDGLYQYQLGGAAAEIAAAIAHAVGTPLNVISGRAELIRQDPANALPQVTRIEEQVRKLADGLRDFVEYLTMEGTATGLTTTGDIPAAQLLARARSLLRPVTDQHQVELVVDDAALASASVAPRSLANLVALLSWAVRCTAGMKHAPPGQRRLQVVGSAIEGSGASGGAVFELRLPGLPLPEHWRIERFEAKAPSAESEAFRLVAICAAVARGQGGKLQADALPDAGGGVRIRLVVRGTGG